MQRAADLARGKWRGILAAFGMPKETLSGRHGPCPMCGGKDRFRFDNRDGEGTYICGQCGSGNGLGLLSKFRGVTFREACVMVVEMIDGISKEAARPEMTEAKRRQLLRDLWKASGPIKEGDAADRYLAARGIGEKVYPEALRFAPECYFATGISYPALLAVVSGPDGKPVSLHRTYLGDGCKAPVAEPRRMMPGVLPPGACVRLSPVQAEIGIAEGIESAMSASALFGLPVWSAISATLLSGWTAPKGVEKVWIFGDNDANFTGHAAAYRLANRLDVSGLEVAVRIPDQGDWNDNLRMQK